MSVLPTSAVSAANPWDNAINTTSSLTIGSSDRTNSYIQYMHDNCDFYYGLFLDAVSDPNGKFAIVQQHITSTVNVVTIEWTTNPSPYTTFLSDNPSPGNYTVGLANTNYHVDLWDTPGFSKCSTGMGASSPLGTTQPGSDIMVFLSTYPVTYPSGYAGEIIPSAAIDEDEDGLDALREQIQGTSDASKDTDGDGLSDYAESEWYPNRDDIFCGVSECAYPDPLKMDIYVEVDWMDDGATAYRPDSTQVGLVADAFDNKDINLHVDTGQYGGGNELPIYIEQLKFAPITGETDFFNLKNGDETYGANFSEDRRGIWHYMITGNKASTYDEDTSAFVNDHTGVSYPSDDDAFIAIGRVKELSPTTEDVAIAGTIIHELGHNLCLSADAYAGQSFNCLFSGVDSYAGNDYMSSMNYDKQLSLVDYSDGSNGTNDHNDWLAVLVGIDDFVTLGEDPMEGLSRGRPAFEKQPMY